MSDQIIQKLEKAPIQEAEGPSPIEKFVQSLLPSGTSDRFG